MGAEMVAVSTMTGPIRTVTGSLPAIDLSGPDLSVPMAPSGVSPLGYLGRGFGVSALNPNAIILLMTIFPQFTRAEQPLPVAGQLAVLGAVFLAQIALVYSGVGYLSSRLLGDRPGAARITTMVAGAVMIVLGAMLLLKRAAESGLIG